MSNGCRFVIPVDGGLIHCRFEDGHEGRHMTGLGAYREGEWLLPPPTVLEIRLARTIIEFCIAHGHPDDGSVPSIPKGKCACEVVPIELVPEEYR